MHIINRFEKPLKNAGIETVDVIEECHELIFYTIAFLNCPSRNYCKLGIVFSIPKNLKLNSKVLFLQLRQNSAYLLVKQNYIIFVV